MNIRLEETAVPFQPGVSLLSSAVDIFITTNGIPVAWENSDHLVIYYDGKKALIKGQIPSHFFRGLGLLQRPITLLDGVQEVISALHENYKLVLATKGDLFDQKRKISASGLQEYFCHIEIMSDKKNADYKRLLDHLGCKAENLLMIGNSIKSDIIPILELGGYAAYVPHHVTWAHEQYEGEVTHSHFIKLNNIKEIQNYL